jgi:transcriptional regulator with PAS, ATPase and Fis domain
MSELRKTKRQERDWTQLRLNLKAPELRLHVKSLLGLGMPKEGLLHALYLRFMAAENRDRNLLCEANLFLAEACRMIGALRQAEILLEELDTIVEKENLPVRLQVAISQIKTWIGMERYHLAERELEKARLLARQSDDPIKTTELALLQCQLLIAFSDLDQAAEELAGITARIHDMSNANLSILLARVQARLHQARGEPKAAIPSFRKAIAILEAHPHVYLLGELYLDFGTMIGELLNSQPQKKRLVKEPASHFLAVAQSCFVKCGSIKKLLETQRAFRLYGQRETDMTSDRDLNTCIESIDREQLNLDQRINRLVAELAQLPQKTEKAQGSPLSRAWRCLLEFYSELNSILIALGKENELLLGEAQRAVLQHNKLVCILKEIEQLGRLEDLDNIYTNATQLVANTTGAKRVILALFEPHQGLQVKVALGAGKQDDSFWRPAAEHVSQTRESVMTQKDDTFLDKRTQTTRAKIPLGRAMAAPLLHQSQLVGIFYVDKQDRAGVFSRRDLEILELLAGQLVTLFENHRMTSALHLAAQTREATLEFLPNGVLDISKEGIIRSLNTSASRFLGYQKEQLERQSIHQVAGLKNILRANEQMDNLDGCVIRLEGGEVVLGIRRIEDLFGKNTGWVVTMTGAKRAQRTAQRLLGSKAHYTFDDMIGRDPEYMLLKRRARLASESDMSILITGESGTGKEVMAQAIHNGHNGGKYPFVGINCAAIPRELLENELFGHEEGAYTGSKKGGLVGKFELAGQGTILLDEIGDMPLEMQAKLLRVIQERRFTRVGGQREIPIEARLIATTNQDLESQVKNKRFRLDLLFRLKVVHLEMIPLRKRVSDIPLFVKYFCKRTANRLSRRTPTVNSRVMKAFMSHPWPGNIRELECVIESEISMLDKQINQITRIPKNLHTPSRVTDLIDDSLTGCNELSLPDTDRRLFTAALKKHKGKVPEVARALSVSRGTVYNKIKKYALDINKYRIKPF